jgi:hypothetical protein
MLMHEVVVDLKRILEFAFLWERRVGENQVAELLVSEVESHKESL